MKLKVKSWLTFAFQKKQGSHEFSHNTSLALDVTYNVQFLLGLNTCKQSFLCWREEGGVLLLGDSISRICKCCA